MIRPLALLLATASVVLADGPKDNLADNVRPIPPPGIEVPAAEAAALQAELACVGARMGGTCSRSLVDHEPNPQNFRPLTSIV